MNQPTRNNVLIILTVLFLGSLLLACTAGVSGVTPTTNASPSWACPSPMPLAYGSAGPVKETVRTERPTAVPSGPVEYDEQPVYYQEWEQEYGTLVSSPPYPTPTPYAVVGTSYVFGQRVRIAPVYALVQAQAGPTLDNGQQLYYVHLTWYNPTAVVIAIDYGLQVKLAAITEPSGRVRSGEWTISKDSFAAAKLFAPAASIPPNETLVTLPIIAPQGVPQIVAITFERTGATTLPDQPTAAAGAATPQPTANTDLQAAADTQLTVQWSHGSIAVGPPCADPGAMTPLQPASGSVWGKESLPVAAPPGAARVVQLALNQVGKPYVWGAEGPETFDCSGLTQWSYGQIGIRIPRTADEQWRGMRHVALPELRPGDLVYFAPPGNRVATHTAMFIGDQNGDGTLDIVHAMSPKFGIRVTNNIFGSAYYNGAKCTLCIVGFTTAR